MTLADKETNLILTDKVNRVTQGNMAMQGTQPSGQNWNQWSVLLEFSSGAIWWVNLELMLVVSSGQNWNQ